jgi:hypothetical protein
MNCHRATKAFDMMTCVWMVKELAWDGVMDAYGTRRITLLTVCLVGFAVSHLLY